MEGRIGRQLIQGEMDLAQFTANNGMVKGIKSRRVGGSTRLGSIRKVKKIIYVEAKREKQNELKANVAHIKFSFCNQGIHEQGLNRVEKVFTTSLRNDIPNRPFGNDTKFQLKGVGSRGFLTINGDSRKNFKLDFRESKQFLQVERNTWSPSLGRSNMPQKGGERKLYRSFQEM